jgi:hypothetical protein
MSKLRGEFIVLLLLVGGFAFNIFAPIWLKPPLFEYTIWLYLIGFFAWVPVYIVYARRLRHPLFVIAFILLGTCMSSYLSIRLLPRSMFGLTYLDRIQCSPLDDVDWRQRIACERISFEGAGNRTLVFESVERLPVMWLLEDRR